MLEAIYTGPELGSGGGGGGSTNPTSGIVPVNQFGTFVDSLIKSSVSIGNGTFIEINDNTETIDINTANASINADGVAGTLDLNDNTAINANDPFYINAHLGLAILRFLSNGSSHAAIKVNGNDVEIKNGNDSAFNNLIAFDITGQDDVITWNNFRFGGSAPAGTISAANDGIFILKNNAGTSFKALNFGGNTAAFYGVSVGTNGLEIRKADLSALAPLFVSVLSANTELQISTRSILTSLTDGNFTLYNNAKTAFSLLQFGGITNAFPALKRVATAIQARLADDSAFCELVANSFTTDGGVFASNNTAIQLRVSGSTTILRGGAAGIQIAASAGAANASAQLEVVSTTRGFLPPRMTNAQRTAIASPAVGLMVYCTDAVEGLYIYKSTGWTFII